MEKILKKICDYLDYVIKELEKNNLSILFDCRDTIYSMCFNGNSLKDIFIEIIPTEKLNRFNNFLLHITNLTSLSHEKKTQMKYLENFNWISQTLKECMEEYDIKSGEKGVDNMNKEYDVFISHANKDKENFVEELYQAINKLGINIFYDKESLEWGDNWKAAILNGTRKSEFAVIVISENFFDREWTEKELAEFLSRQNRNGQKLILPILHNITLAQLQKRYPSVADIQAIDSKKYTCDQIAIMFARQLIKRLKNI